jgi:hypothetical protein
MTRNKPTLLFILKNYILMALNFSEKKRTNKLMIKTAN